MNEKNWYELSYPDEIDSPALLIYKDRVAQNIQTMIDIAGDAKMLVPYKNSQNGRDCEDAIKGRYFPI